MQEVFKHTKTVVSSLRRGVKDIDSMRKSVAKAKQRFDEQMRKAQEGPAQHGGLAGRTTFQFTDSDPQILKSFKWLGSTQDTTKGSVVPMHMSTCSNRNPFKFTTIKCSILYAMIKID